MFLELLLKWTSQDGADATCAPQSPKFPQDVNDKMCKHTHLIQSSKRNPVDVKQD